MKKGLGFLILFLGVAGLLPAAEKSLWIEDFEAAKKAAAQSGKDILVDMDGSDWCPPCIKMEEEVFSRPEFAAQIPGKYILLRLDFPKKTTQDSKVRRQNEKLAQLYPFEGFPTYFLMDKTGKPFGAYTGYLAGGTKAFFKLLNDLNGQKTSLQTLQAAADQAAAGQDKAQKMHALYSQASNWNLENYYSDLPAKVIQEDKDNKAGLKARYQLLGEYSYLMNTWTQDTDFNQAALDVSKLADKAAAVPDLQQKILFTLGMVYLNALADPVKAKAAFIKTKTMDAASPVGMKAAEMLDQLP